LRLLSAVSLLLVLAATCHAQNPGNPPSSASSTAAAKAFSGVSTSLLLDGTLSSADAKVGHKVKSYFRKDTTLPTGEVVPVHALLLGQVVNVSKKSKDKPNGILEIAFDTIVLKSGTKIPVEVKIKDINSPGADETGGPSIEKKPKKGEPKKADDEEAKPKVPNQTSVPGIFLQIPADGSGIFYSAGDNVELEDGMQVTALIARASVPTRAN